MSHVQSDYILGEAAPVMQLHHQLGLQQQVLQGAACPLRLLQVPVQLEGLLLVLLGGPYPQVEPGGLLQVQLAGLLLVLVQPVDLLQALVLLTPPTKRNAK